MAPMEATMGDDLFHCPGDVFRVHACLKEAAIAAKRPVSTHPNFPMMVGQLRDAEHDARAVLAGGIERLHDDIVRTGHSGANYLV